MRPTLPNKSIFRFIAVLFAVIPVLGLGQCVTSNGITTCTYVGTTVNTTGSWVVPCGVNSFTVRVIGGGGGGGSAQGDPDGSGGGGGGFATATFNGVSPGTSYNFQAGAYGTGSTNTSDGGNGNISWFGTSALMFAGGGYGGNTQGLNNPSASPFNGLGGNFGGTASGLSGANGFNGASSTNSQGGSGGNSGYGNGGGVTNTSLNSTGASGSSGGGGAGANDDGGGRNDGGNGGAGIVIITYISPFAGIDQTLSCGVFNTSLVANSPASGTGTWSVVSGTSVTFGNVNSASTTVSYTSSCVTLRWTWSGSGCTSIFDDIVICTDVTSLCNDNPCNASPLTIVNGSSCAPTVNQSTANSTYSTGMPDPSCGYVNTGAGSGDTWYSAVVPADGQLQVTALGGGDFDPMISIYDGACTSLQSAGCVDPVGFASNSFPLTYAGTPGSTIYIRVNEAVSGDATTGAFGLCAYTTNTGTISQVLPGTTTTVSCGSSLNFYDTGGAGGTTTTNTSQPPPAGNYTNNTGTTWTICPSDPTQYVRIQFNQFTLESGFDKLIITSGNNNVIAQWTGNDGQGDIVTSQNPGECLTLYFQSDYIFTAEGWEALVSCTTAVAPSQVNNECLVQNCTGGCGKWICADGIYNTAAGSGSGIDEINEVTGGCWGGAGEVATSWFYFTTGSAGQLAFEFIPSNSGHNINFALYGPTTNGVPPCPLITGDAPIRCSFADVGGANTGLQAGQTDLYDGTYGNSFAAPLTVAAGQTYALAIDVYQNGQPPTQTQIDFTGAATLDCTPVTLPITLSDFSGINQGRSNLLSWIVNSQMNNDFFTVERSLDGQTWEVVGHVDGAGTTQSTMFYSLIDETPYFPVTYYRLAQTDIDGERTYSHVIALSNNKNENGEFIGNLFPNPSSQFATFTYDGTNTNAPLNVKVINSLGQTVQEVNHVNLHKGVGLNLVTVGFAEGVYQVVFTQGNERQVQKLTILR